jgi:DNA mismatch endonuclease (patch repair protein)
VHGTRPVANAEWWADKLARTVSRDRETDAALGAAGWLVLRYWEHEDMVAAAQVVAAEVATRCGRPR